MKEVRIRHEVPYYFFSSKKPRMVPWEETVVLPETWKELFDIRGSFAQYGSNNLEETFTVDYGAFRFEADYSCMNEEYVVTLFQMTCDYRRKEPWKYEEVETWYPETEQGIAEAIIAALDIINDEFNTDFRLEIKAEVLMELYHRE